MRSIDFLRHSVEIYAFLFSLKKFFKNFYLNEKYPLVTHSKLIGRDQIFQATWLIAK